MIGWVEGGVIGCGEGVSEGVSEGYEKVCVRGVRRYATCLISCREMHRDRV